MNVDTAGADVSDRVRLARVALKAAVASVDVVRGDAGTGVPRVTRDAAGLLVGVTAIAQADGRYEVDLRLVARLVPLVALGAQVRERVTAAARRGGLDDQLGNVNVEFVDLQTADDTVADAAPIEQEPTPLGTTKPGEVLAGDASATLTPDAPSTQSMPSIDPPPPKGSA